MGVPGCGGCQFLTYTRGNPLRRKTVKPRNFLLEATLEIKTIVFSGSSLDGSKPASGEGTRFFLPRHWRDQPTVTPDLFALGSTLYEIS
ncbi:uncharacterized protein BDW43DRAFT_260115 [Aspergillus alliaceus]|uniref:uncharacterized protein n=1 Tax=Petromyces alliaceus TaxID=209559 RepID=UPI0012A610C0|nr:uncharacterized protein BDW43DRAFT_260115 [Aspergillus alliaceus]KAB8238887.1 hypothetical protein BDW43DRAFT_260115 [Aspergillus alliaceus]